MEALMFWRNVVNDEKDGAFRHLKFKLVRAGFVNRNRHMQATQIALAHYDIANGVAGSSVSASRACQHSS